MGRIDGPLALWVDQLDERQLQQNPRKKRQRNRQENSQEAYDALLQMARRRTGRVPPELLAGHVVGIYGEADWPMKRAAMEALLRRFGFARRDALRVAARPAKGAPLGLYETRPRRAGARPYRTLLRSLAPLDGSCDCPDFLRSSLGLCKHLLVVVDALARSHASSRRRCADARR